MERIRRGIEWVDLFALGGGCYCLIELCWRAQTHWTMFALSGGLFLMLIDLNRRLPQRWSLLLRGVLGAALITAAEFLCGVVVNLNLGLSVWDYSSMPMNFLGQICLPYSLLWLLLAMLAPLLGGVICRFAWGDAPFYCRIL